MLDNDTRGWIMAVVSGIGMFVCVIEEEFVTNVYTQHVRLARR